MFWQALARDRFMKTLDPPLETPCRLKIKSSAAPPNTHRPSLSPSK
jgi:hypothetical protein